jgi:hypothetical protein
MAADPTAQELTGTCEMAGHDRVEFPMTQTLAVRLARFLWVLALLLAVGGAVLMARNLPVRSDMFYLALLAPGFSTVGMVIATRRRNMVGWLFLAVGLAGGVGAFTGEYALRTLQAEPGSLPAGAFMAWVSSWVVLWVVVMVFLLLLVFPDGQLPTTRWRPVAWGLVGSFGLWVLWIMVWPQAIDFEGTKIANPFRIPALAHPGIAGQVLGALDLVVACAALSASGVAPFVRWRRAGATERLQFKWLLLVVVAVPGGVAASLASWTVLPGGWSRPAATSSVSSSPRSPSPESRQRWRSPSSGTGCTTSTASSTAPWSTGCSRSSSASAMPGRS